MHDPIISRETKSCLLAFFGAAGTVVNTGTILNGNTSTLLWVALAISLALLYWSFRLRKKAKKNNVKKLLEGNE